MYPSEKRKSRYFRKILQNFPVLNGTYVGSCYELRQEKEQNKEWRTKGKKK